MRRPGLNTNDFFSDKLGLPKTQLKLNQFGVSQGGPIKLPGLRRLRQGVLLHQLRGVLSADVDAPAHAAAPESEQVAGGLFRYNVQRRRTVTAKSTC